MVRTYRPGACAVTYQHSANRNERKGSTGLHVCHVEHRTLVISEYVESGFVDSLGVHCKT